MVSVLVVDDDVSFRSLAAQLLRAWGFDVVAEAGTATEALDRTTELEPDTVLADIGLPDGNGFTLTEHLRALPRPPRVVLISTDADAANVLVARRAGACGFVAKEDLAGRQLRALLAGE